MLKECPFCKKKHEKRGKYCSQLCSVKMPKTEEHKKSIGVSQKKFMNSGSDVAQHNIWVLNNRELDNELLEPIFPKFDSDNSFVEGGDLWKMEE